MRPRFEYGDEVRVTRNVRNDGTYPGMDVGAPLVRRGCTGYVINVGTYLQDQIIYSVHFFDDGLMVGCREEELIPASAPWMPSRFEFRDKVVARIPMSINGEVVVAAGDSGEILKVLRDSPAGEPTGKTVLYHVRFPGRTLQVPESALDALETSDSADDAVADDARTGDEA